MKLKNDIKWMDFAIRQSLEAIGRSSPNPPVGAVLVKNDRCIAKGATEKPGGSHAEIVALKIAGQNAGGASLYVTLEPCCFQGRTPPCTDAIISARIKRVVIGHPDKHPRVLSRGVRQLKQAGIKVDLLKERSNQCSSILHPFFKSIGVFSDKNKSKSPEYIMKAGITLDGYLATSKKSSQWITHKFSRILVHRLRSLADAVLIGLSTARADNPELTARPGEEQKGLFNSVHYSGNLPEEDAFTKYILSSKNGFYNKKSNPLRVVLDSSLDLPKKSKLVLSAKEFPTLVIINKKKEKGLGRKIRLMEKLGVEIRVAQPKGQGLDLDDINRILLDKGVLRVLVEGGSKIHKSFQQAKLYDRYYIFVAAKFLQGADGIPLFSGMGVRDMNRAFIIPNQKVICLPSILNADCTNILITGAGNHVYGNS